MRKIFKYTLDLARMVEEGTNIQTIDMPTTALLHHVGAQGGQICLWAEVNTEYPGGKRTFCVVGTGHDIPAEAKSYDYRGTVHMSPFVWHVYEIK